MKRRYQKRFLESILGAQKKNVSHEDHIKDVNIRDIIFWISEAWDEVLCSTIYKCWKKLLPNSFYEKSTEDLSTESVISNSNLINDFENIPGYSGLTDENIQNWIDFDDSVPSNEDLLAIISKDNIEGDISISSEDSLQSEGYISISSNDSLQSDTISCEDASNALDNLLKFFEKHEGLLSSEMEVFKKAKEVVVKIQHKNK